MFNRKPPEVADGLINQAVATAEAAVESTQRAADHAMDSLSHSLQAARQHVVPALHDVGEKASTLARHGMEAVRDTSRMVSHNAQKATDNTVAYIREEPVKAILVTAVIAAGLISIFRLFARPSRLR